MKLVIPVSAHDQHRLSKFVDVLLKFGSLEEHPILFHPTPDAADITYKQAERLSLYRPEVIPTEKNFEHGAPVACGQHFASAVRLLGNTGNRLPWLWMELDMLPVVPNWAGKLQREYNDRDRPFLGNVVPVPYWNAQEQKIEFKSGDQMLMGCAIYPPGLDKDQRTFPLINSLAKPFSFNPKQPFDLFLRYAFQQIGWANTTLISDQWNTGRYSLVEGVMVCEPLKHDKPHRPRGGFIAEEAVLIHGCKDDSLYEIIMGEQFVLSADKPSGTSLAHPAKTSEATQDSSGHGNVPSNPVGSQQITGDQEAGSSQPAVGASNGAPTDKRTLSEILAKGPTTLKFVSVQLGVEKDEARKMIEAAGYSIGRGGRLHKNTEGEM